MMLGFWKCFLYSLVDLSDHYYFGAAMLISRHSSKIKLAADRLGEAQVHPFV